jgi:hypothetical protein
MQKQPYHKTLANQNPNAMPPNKGSGSSFYLVICHCHFTRARLMYSWCRDRRFSRLPACRTTLLQTWQAVRLAWPVLTIPISSATHTCTCQAVRRTAFAVPVCNALLALPRRQNTVAQLPAVCLWFGNSIYTCSCIAAACNPTAVSVRAETNCALSGPASRRCTRCIG